MSFVRGGGGESVVDISAPSRSVSKAPSVPLPVRARVTSSMLSNPDAMVRYLSEESLRLDRIAALLSQAVFTSGINLRNIAMTGAATNLVDHRLGRPYVGWVLTRVVATGATIPRVCERALPTDRSSSQWIQLDADQACSIDIYIY